jgi:capsular polysaccharide export protein
MKGGAETRGLFCFNGGFFTNPRVRSILALAGYDVRFGKPTDDDLIGVWGKSPTSGRGETVANLTSSQIYHIEDALLRSVRLGRDGEAPLGLTIDSQRPYFDSSGPSDLEDLLASAPFDDTAILDRSRRAMVQLRDCNLSKYNDFPLEAKVPDPGYVLVIDQTRDDASIAYGGANLGTFQEMLVFAQEENPGARIVVKTHPDVTAGHREGHFGQDNGPLVEMFDTPVSPYALLEGAIAVYTVSSGMGFEAIIAGHKPVVFGQPFYAGWGLSDDRNPIDRRTRNLTRAQMFAGVMIEYPTWYDPYRDELCELETVMDTLQSQARARREDSGGYRFQHISNWKRPALTGFFGNIKFGGDGPERSVVWASKDLDREGVIRVEDGFIRSNGLGAKLVAPLSLVLDDLGIYFDPTRPSRLEKILADPLNEYQRERARTLRIALINHGLSKYNLGGESPTFDAGGRKVILVPGQVEDDASILRGALGAVRDNTSLLAAVRRDFPDAFIIYKPHPDVEAGLRIGAIEDADADFVASKADVISLLAVVDRVATMTSLTGFEALVREVPVTCYGAPFYAGWGLTDDRGAVPERRKARVDLEGLVHTCLIDYPRYFDPVTLTACPVEVVAERLAKGEISEPTRHIRLLSKIQTAFAGYARFWR